MITISVINQKGGVGKSTVATCLYHSFKRAGKITSFRNLDPQGGSLATVLEDNTEILIVDTPCGYNDDTVKIIDESDILVIPTFLTGKEADALFRVMTLVAAKKKPFVVVLNGMDNRVKSKTKFATEVSSLKSIDFSNAVITSLPTSIDIPNAQTKGMSVVEHKPRSKASKAVIEMCNAVRKLAGVEPEELRPKLFATKQPAMIEKKGDK